MRLALVCDEYPPGPHGGVGTFTCDLAEGLAGAGHEVTVVVTELGPPGYWSETGEAERGRNPRLEPCRLESPAWMRWRPGSLWQRWCLRRFVRSLHRKRPFDLVESMDNWGLFPFGGGSGYPLVVRLHGATFLFDKELGLHTSDRFTHWLERRTLARADFLAGVSEWISRRELELAGVAREVDATIYNSVDPDFFAPRPEVPVERGLIVFANSIHPRKGVRQLCQSMNLLGSTHPHARLLLIGKHIAMGESGRPLWEECLEEVRPEFRERVHFTGRLQYRSEVLEHLRRAEVCCYPSTLEGLGIAPLEAMSLGKPTVFSRTGPGAEVIEDGISGLLCDPHDPGDIAAKIGSILDDPSLGRRLGEAGRERVLHKFNRADWILRNEAFYRQCLERDA